MDSSFYGIQKLRTRFCIRNRTRISDTSTTPALIPYARTFHKYSLFIQLKTLIFSYGTLSTLLILAVRSSNSTQVDSREILIINLRES